MMKGDVEDGTERLVIPVLGIGISGIYINHRPRGSVVVNRASKLDIYVPMGIIVGINGSGCGEGNKEVEEVSTCTALVKV